MDKRLRFAIVGMGRIGHKHLAHIQANPNTVLAAAADINPEMQADLPEGTPFFKDIEEMLRDVDFDVLCICTPNYLHSRHAIAGLIHGHHVVVEKPMSLTVKDCDAIIEAGKTARKKIFTVMQNRYSPIARMAKDTIDSNRLGDVYMIQVNCFWNRNADYYHQSAWRGTKQMDGGVLFTQFSHFVDMLYFLHGPMKEYISGTMGNYGHKGITEIEDSGSCIMLSEKGAIVNFNFTTCAYKQNMESAITIFARNGTLKLGGQYLNKVAYQCLAGDPLPNINITGKSNDYGFYKGSMNNHDKVIQNVVDVLQHNAAMNTTAEDGRAVVEIIQNMYSHAGKI